MIWKKLSGGNSMIRFFNFKVPQGMVLQQYVDGSYNILYDDKNIVVLRDWAAILTNTLSSKAAEYITDQKNDDEKKWKEKAERGKRTAQFEREIKRVDTTIDMMGNITPIDQPTIFSNQSKTPNPKNTMEIIKPESRMVNTINGPVEVAGDVSDAELKKMGFIIPEDSENIKPLNYAFSDRAVSEAELHNLKLPVSDSNGADRKVTGDEQNTES
jgi:hypothetical protein